jgi:hypothetical protein
MEENKGGSQVPQWASFPRHNGRVLSRAEAEAEAEAHRWADRGAGRGVAGDRPPECPGAPI